MILKVAIRKERFGGKAEIEVKVDLNFGKFGESNPDLLRDRRTLLPLYYGGSGNVSASSFEIDI